MRLFLVKWQKGVIDPNQPQKGWKAEEPYPVYEVYKYLQKDKESGISQIVTKFLVCNPTTGEMRWVDSKGLTYISD